MPWWMRIKGRVLFFGIAMSIFPLIFLGLASFNAARLHLERSIQEQNVERATVLASQISDFVQNMTDSLTHVTSTNASVLVGKDTVTRGTVLNTLLREEPYIDSIIVSDREFRILGRVARREVIFPESGVRKMDNLAFSGDESRSVSRVFFTEDGRPEFYLTLPIRDPQTRRTMGYLQAKTDLKGMVTKFANLRIGQAGYAYLVDENGTLIGHSDFSHVLRQEDVHQNPEVQMFLAGENPPHRGSEYQNDKGLTVLGVFATVKNPNWAVFIEQPTQEAYEPIYDFAWKLLGIVLVAVGLVTLISIYFGLKLTQPIENLEGEVRRIISTGKLKSTIPQETQDEIGRLVQSFNQLLHLLDEKNKNLRAEKELLTTVVDGIGAGMALLDGDKHILWWNTIFAEWFGSEDLENLPCESVLAGEGIDCLFLENGRVIAREVSGERRYIRQMYYHLTPENQEQAAFLLLLEDVTQQVEMEARVIETDKMAAVGLLASGVAHEINNPLAIVSAHSEDMLDRLNEEVFAPTPEEIKGVLRIVSEQIMRCKQITERLLYFARRGKQGRDLIDIGAATVNTVALLGHRTKQRQIYIYTSFEQGLFVLGNENEWQQVILNIMTNAVDASPNGGKIEVRGCCLGQAIQVEIEDQGDGIPPGQLKKVFDPFYTTKPPGQGTGLGLFVSYGIVQKMRGSLTLESTEGKGTIVKISLPFQEREGKG